MSVNRIANRPPARPTDQTPAVTREDVMEACRGVCDVLRKDVLGVARIACDALRADDKAQAAAFEKTFAAQEARVEEALDGLRQEYADRLEELRRAQADALRRIEGLQAAYLDSLGQLADAIKSLPAPRVEVNLPELQSFTSVNVPETAPPTVTVQAPPAPRKTTKHIAYDDYGRPDTITESETT